MDTFKLFYGLLSLFFLALAVVIFARVRGAEARDRLKFMRAGVGAVAAAVGCGLLITAPGLSLLFYLIAAILIFSRGPVSPSHH